METSAIYGLGKLLGHHCLSLNTVVANRVSKQFSKNAVESIEKLIKRTLEIIESILKKFMAFSFYKYQGTGNDFIIIDNRTNNIQLSKLQVNKLCDRHFGIGADGLMLMNNHAEYDFEMKYYNADGNEGSMCGNGGRCMVQFAYDLGLHKREYFFTAVDGEHKASIEDNGWIDLKMTDVNTVEIADYSDYILNTGSPHYVKPVRGYLEL